MSIFTSLTEIKIHQMDKNSIETTTKSSNFTHLRNISPQLLHGVRQRGVLFLQALLQHHNQNKTIKNEHNSKPRFKQLRIQTFSSSALASLSTVSERESLSDSIWNLKSATISSFSEILERRTEDSDSSIETRVERAMEVILRATSSCSKGSEGSTCKTLSGRSKPELPDSLPCIFNAVSVSLSLSLST